MENIIPKSGKHELSQSVCMFRAPVNFGEADVGGSENGARRFEGIAYGGGVITDHGWWDRVAFDLAETEVTERLPFLFVHNDSRPVGQGEMNLNNAQIQVAGTLSSVYEDGQRIAGSSDEGFPWQLSVRIIPDRVDFIDEGSSEIINGRNMEGPLHIFRGNRIREVSFVPVGADSNTEATAMSGDDDGNIALLFNSNDDGESTMSKELEQQLAQMKKERDKFASENTELKTQLGQNTQVLETLSTDFKALQTEFGTITASYAAKTAAERDSEIKKLFSVIGVEFSDATAKPYRDMSAETFSQVVKDLGAVKKTTPSGVFNEFEGSAGNQGASGGADHKSLVKAGVSLFSGDDNTKATVQ